VIDQGKKDRGPGFVHSPEQRDALLDSLKMFLKNNPPSQVEIPIQPSPLEQQSPLGQPLLGSVDDDATQISGAAENSNTGVSNSVSTRDINSLAELLNNQDAKALLDSYLNTDTTLTTRTARKYCEALSMRTPDGEMLTINGKNPSFIHILLAHSEVTNNDIRYWFSAHSHYVLREFLHQSIKAQLNTPNNIDPDLAAQWDFVDYHREGSKGIDQIPLLIKKLSGGSITDEVDIRDRVFVLLKNDKFVKSIKHHQVLPKQREYLNCTVGDKSFLKLWQDKKQPTNNKDPCTTLIFHRKL